MEELTDKDKEFLLKLARQAIEYYFKNGQVLNVPPDEIESPALIEDAACFVTLHSNGDKLRGCIGTLEAHRPLFADVVGNALAAAFEDTRFTPLTHPELKDVKISISVLTKPVKFDGDGEALFEALEPKKHGLIIQKGVARATFLPAVWEQLPEKEKFLDQLCLKAGMGPGAWKDEGVEFFLYKAVEFSE
ncbi:TPA: AmmeMemoRadiSam system protein A [Candidatus Micrarchaeota archaeon]|nr:AmmeMemoRadiSam system protein A [Candidatus Micrarchaeota archaeon]